jgi:hypothetical protein
MLQALLHQYMPRHTHLGLDGAGCASTRYTLMECPPTGEGFAAASACWEEAARSPGCKRVEVRLDGIEAHAVQGWPAACWFWHPCDSLAAPLSLAPLALLWQALEAFSTSLSLNPDNKELRGRVKQAERSLHQQAKKPPGAEAGRSSKGGRSEVSFSFPLPVAGRSARRKPAASSRLADLLRPCNGAG